MDGHIDYTYSIIGYEPSEVASIVCLVLFAVLGLVMLALNIKYKTWFFMALVGGAALETFGLAFRLVVKEKPYSVPIYILFAVPILVAPTIFAIADYSLVAKMYDCHVLLFFTLLVCKKEA